MDREVGGQDTTDQTFRFLSTLFASGDNTSASEQGIMMDVSLFDRLTVIDYAAPSLNNTPSSLSLGGNYSISVDPTLAKLSLSIFRWPWVTPVENRLRAKIMVDPPFSSFVARPNTPQARMTTVDLLGQKSSQGRSVSTRVRLVEFGLADGGEEEVAVEFSINVTESSISLEFGYFASSLYFDPDFGVIVGQEAGKSSDSDVALIVAVSVAVPVAIGFVVLVVVAGVLLAWWRRSRNVARRQFINFDEHEAL